MIEYINNQLNQWAEWERTGKTRLGYPNKAAFVSAMGGGGRLCTMPDEEGLAMSRAVAALRPDLRAVVDCFYKTMRSCTGEEVATYLGISKATLFRRMDAAHNAILGSLNDIAAGLAVPPWTAEAVKLPLTYETVAVEFH